MYNVLISAILISQFWHNNNVYNNHSFDIIVAVVYLLRIYNINFKILIGVDISE